MSFDGYPTIGAYIVAKEYEARRNAFLLLVVPAIILLFGVIIFFAYESKALTQQEAQYEYCLITKSLEFPNASSTVIDRICELEKIGRAM